MLEKLAFRVARVARVVVREISGGLSRLEGRFEDSHDPQLHHERVVQSTVRHDMARHPDERHYADQYLHWISPELPGCVTGGPPLCLDVGCGQGRLSLEIARSVLPLGGRVIGVDLSSPALDQARSYAREMDVRNVEFRKNDGLAFLRECAEGSADAILLTEVVFFFPDFRSLLRECHRVLRIGGKLFASFRSLYFHTMCVVGNRSWKDAERLLVEREGRLYGGGATQTWQTSTEVKSLLAEAGFNVLDLLAIGALSGIPGDPHAMLARPSLLTEEEQHALQRTEIEVARTVPDAGRYMLAVAEKT